MTGGIASGKSAAARVFEELGFAVVDADRISRELNAPGGAAYEAIVRRFGTGDRAQLREIVFADPEARKDLEEILHPLIREASLRAIRERVSALPAERREWPAIYEASLLVETGRYRDLDGLIVVEAPRELRIERLMARDGCTREQAERILAAQASDEERRRAATWVIENSGTLDELKRQTTEAAVRLRPGYKNRD